MEYRIAVASADGTYVDAHFGSAQRFYIYDVEAGAAQLAEVRVYEAEEKQPLHETASERPDGGGSVTETAADGAKGPGQSVNEMDSEAADGTVLLTKVAEAAGGLHDAAAASGDGHTCGCGRSGEIPGKVAMLRDCRFLLCAAAGPGAVRRLEAAGVTVFDVELPVGQALEKLTAFYR